MRVKAILKGKEIEFLKSLIINKPESEITDALMEKYR